MGKKKKDGKIFTPEPIVKHMLYNEMWRHHELDQHIIDNSCGDGAFLCEIVSDYCETYKFEHMRKGSDLKTTLETYIHGIEIDPVEHKKCLENLDAVAEKYGVKGVKWDVQNRDALSCHDYDGKMDYVIANPPYIRSGIIPTLMPEVRDHEPHIALDGGEDGLDIYRRIAQGAHKHLRKHGMIFLEIGYDQSEDVTAVLDEYGFADITTIKDYCDNDRVIMAKMK